MATFQYIKESKQTISAMKGVINYCVQDKKVYDEDSSRRLVSGVNCDGENAFTEFMFTKESYKKTDGMNFYQYVQSFSQDEKISAEDVHKIGLEFAEKAWPGYEVLVATHSDADHLHNHFVINSVGFENGKKLRQPPDTVKKLRGLNDDICKSHGLSVLEPYTKSGDKLSTREYRAAEKGDSWKFRLMSEIDNAMKKSGNKNDFFNEMNKQGYKVTWTKERKYITFICPDGKKCRDIKLHDEKYLKENMEYELQLRAMLYNKKKYYDSESCRKEFAEYTEPQSEFYACDGSDSGKGLGYNGGTSEYEYRTLSEDNGIVYQTSDSQKNGRNNECLVGESRINEQRIIDEDGKIPGDLSEENGKYTRRNETPRNTGWEQNRRDYERFIGKDRVVNNESGRRSKNVNQTKSSNSVRNRNARVLNNVGTVCSALSTLGAIGGKRKDDEEEEPDATMGVIAGLAIGTALAIYEHKKEKERNNENEIDKSTSAYSNRYEDANNEENENEEYTGPVMSGM